MTLHFAILSFDRYSRDSLIGEVFFTLNEKELLESIEKEHVSIQKDIILRTVKVCLHDCNCVLFKNNYKQRIVKKKVQFYFINIVLE